MGSRIDDEMSSVYQSLFRSRVGVKQQATALYFYGSIILRALKSKITVILTNAQKRYCGFSNYVKVLIHRLTIITITK